MKLNINKTSTLMGLVLIGASYGTAVTAEIVREERDVSGFEAVVVSGTGRLELAQGRE